MLPIIKFEMMNLIDRLKKRFKKPKKVDCLEVITDKCTGCRRCVTGCKHDVFAIKDGKAIVNRLSECVGCGKCVEKMCKFEAIKLVISKD